MQYLSTYLAVGVQMLLASTVTRTMVLDDKPEMPCVPEDARLNVLLIDGVGQQPSRDETWPSRDSLGRKSAPTAVPCQWP